MTSFRLYTILQFSITISHLIIHLKPHNKTGSDSGSGSSDWKKLSFDTSEDLILFFIQWNSATVDNETAEEGMDTADERCGKKKEERE